MRFDSAYATTMTNPYGANDKFYNDLYDAISATPLTDKLNRLTDKLNRLGHVNARVGTDHRTCP